MARSHAIWLVVALLPIAVIAVYLLSTGPAMVLIHADLLEESTYMTVYWPLVWVYNRNDMFARVWDSYDNFWLELCGYPPLY